MRVFALPDKKLVSRVRFTADGESVAVVWNGRPWVQYFSLQTGERTPWRPTPALPPACLEFSADNQFVAVGQTGAAARVYRRGEVSPVVEHQLGFGENGTFRQPVEVVAFAPNDDPLRQWLAIVGSEFWLWNATTQQYLVWPEQDFYQSAAFASDSSAVFLARMESVARVSIKPFTEAWRVPLLPIRLATTSHVLACPDGAVVLVSDSYDVALLDAEDGSLRGRFRLVKSSAREMAFLPNSRLLAVADGSPTLRVYDTDTGTVAREYDWGIGGIHCVTFSHDGAMGAAGGDKGRVVVWDVE